MSEAAEKPRVLLLSGPNLDLLGVRQPEIYGSATLSQYVDIAASEAATFGLEFDHRQTNSDGDLVEIVHQARGAASAIILNAGALTHTSWSLHDAMAAFEGVKIELHISNPQAREAFRHRSVVAAVVDGTIAGFGIVGYRLAIIAAATLLGQRQ